MTREEYIRHWTMQWVLYGRLPPMMVLRKNGKSRFAEGVTGKSIVTRLRTNVSRLVTAETSPTEQEQQ